MNTTELLSHARVTLNPSEFDVLRMEMFEARIPRCPVMGLCNFAWCGVVVMNLNFEYKIKEVLCLSYS